jgi:MASE9
MLVAVYVTLVVAAGGLALWAAGAPDPTLGPLPLLFWFLANLLGEVLWLPAPKGRGYLSMANAANIATLILLPISTALLLCAAAGLVADFVFRRRAWYQGMFNFGMCASTVFVAATVFHFAGGQSRNVSDLVSPLNAIPLFLTAFTYFLINAGLVAGVVGLNSGGSVREVWRTSFAFPYELAGALVLNLLGYLFAILFLTWGYMSAFVAVIATYFIRDAYVRYVRDAHPAEPSALDDAA